MVIIKKSNYSNAGIGFSTNLLCVVLLSQK